MVYLQEKDEIDYNGTERDIKQKINTDDISWLPIGNSPPDKKRKSLNLITGRGHRTRSTVKLPEKHLQSDRRYSTNSTENQKNRLFKGRYRKMIKI